MYKGGEQSWGAGSRDFLQGTGVRSGTKKYREMEPSNLI